MKKIGIIFALIEELNSVKEHLILEKEYNIFDIKFYECKMDNTKIILALSGMGKVNAARTTQILIDNFKIDYVFNVGVAGGVDSSLKVGDIVVGTKLVQHDFDMTALNHEKGFIPDTGKYFECDEYLINTAYKIINENPIINCHKGVIASGDIFCTDPKMALKINTKFNALCTEMEGASVAQVCFLSHIPFVIIRSISDIPNNDNAISYEEFLVNSLKITGLSIKKIILQINNEMK